MGTPVESDAEEEEDDDQIPSLKGTKQSRRVCTTATLTFLDSLLDFSQRFLTFSTIFLPYHFISHISPLPQHPPPPPHPHTLIHSLPPPPSYFQTSKTSKHPSPDRARSPSSSMMANMLMDPDLDDTSIATPPPHHNPLPPSSKSPHRTPRGSILRGSASNSPPHRRKSLINMIKKDLSMSMMVCSCTHSLSTHYLSIHVVSTINTVNIVVLHLPHLMSLITTCPITLGASSQTTCYQRYIKR